MLPQWLTRILDAHKSDWGSQSFVELTIFINLAIFEIDKLATYGRALRGWALKAALAAKLDVLDQEEKHAGSKIIAKFIVFLAHGHKVVWNTCKFGMYAAVVLAALLLYVDAKNDAYFVFLLIPPALYLSMVILAIIGLWVYCFFVRVILNIKEPTNPDNEIRKLIDRFK
jgi:hypothetical protein